MSQFTNTANFQDTFVEETRFQETFDAMSKSKSFYVPLMPKDIVLADGSPLYEERSLRYLFEVSMGLGKVSRVDYISKPTRADPHAISVFVHFTEWISSGITDRIISQFNADGECIVRGYYDPLSGRGYQFVSSFNRRPRFFKMKVNRSPVPEVVEVPTNIHQIVHDNGVLREVLAKQTSRIAELEEEVRRLTAHANCDLANEPTAVMNVI